MYNMIKTFANKETEKIYNGYFVKKYPYDIQHAARRKLRMLNNSHTLLDLQIPPSNKLEKLIGERKNQYSIRINDQWRICFEWKNNDAINVEIIDYQKKYIYRKEEFRK